MKTSGYCVCYREPGSEEWRFVRQPLYGGESTVAVLPSHEQALSILASIGFDVDTETQIVPVTVSGRMK